MSKEKLKKLVVKLRGILKKDYRILILQIYALILLFGFILTLLYAAIPSLTICSNLFGDNFCTPAGIYIGLTASLPGYLIAGNLLTSFNTLPAGVSFFVVILSSALVYFIIGALIDRLRKSSVSKPVVIIITSILILLILLTFLLVRLM